MAANKVLAMSQESRLSESFGGLDMLEKPSAPLTSEKRQVTSLWSSSGWILLQAGTPRSATTGSRMRFSRVLDHQREMNKSGKKGTDMIRHKTSHKLCVHRYKRSWGIERQVQRAVRDGEQTQWNRRSVEDGIAGWGLTFKKSIWNQAGTERWAEDTEVDTEANMQGIISSWHTFTYQERISQALVVDSNLIDYGRNETPT